MDVLIILVLLVVILGIWVVSTQRKLVMMDENINIAMSQIGIQLSSRFDALIALLDLARENAVSDAPLWIEKVKSNRRDILAKSMPKEALEQEQVIVETLQFINQVVEQYPEIKETKTYVKRMGAMDTYERMLRTSHLIYNDSVAKYNQFIRMFPTKWLAGILGFREREYFKMI